MDTFTVVVPHQHKYPNTCIILAKQQQQHPSYKYISPFNIHSHLRVFRSSDVSLHHIERCFLHIVHIQGKGGGAIQLIN